MQLWGRGGLQAEPFLLPERRIESDADLVAATTTAGGPFFSAAKKIRIRRGDSLQKAAHPQTIPQHAFHHALPTRLALDVLHGDGHEAGSTVAAKADADAPGGGISLCFCRRGCAAPAQKPSRSTKPAATLNDTRRSTRLKSRHAQRSAATKTNTKNSIFVNPGLTLGRVPKMRSRKGI